MPLLGDILTSFERAILHESEDMMPNPSDYWAMSEKERQAFDYARDQKIAENAPYFDPISGRQLDASDNAKMQLYLTGKDSKPLIDDMLAGAVKGLDNFQASFTGKSMSDHIGDFTSDIMARASQGASYMPSSAAGVSSAGVKTSPVYTYADLAKMYGMDNDTAYQEALANTSYQRMVKDLQAAGLNPALALGRSGAASFSGSSLGDAASVNASLSSAKTSKALFKLAGAVAGLVFGKSAGAATTGAKIGEFVSDVV